MTNKTDKSKTSWTGFNWLSGDKGLLNTGRDVYAAMKLELPGKGAIVNLLSPLLFLWVVGKLMWVRWIR